MAAIYYEKIDVEGHHFGPDSEQVRTAVQQLDLAMLTLNSKIKEKNMVNQLNIVLFSDHGMTKIQWMEKVIELDKFINMSDIVKMMDRGAVVNMHTVHSSSGNNKPQRTIKTHDSFIAAMILPTNSYFTCCNCKNSCCNRYFTCCNCKNSCCNRYFTCCNCNYTCCNRNYSCCNHKYTCCNRNYTCCNRNYICCNRNYTSCNRYFTWCNRNYTCWNRNYSCCNRYFSCCNCFSSNCHYAYCIYSCCDRIFIHSCIYHCFSSSRSLHLLRPAQSLLSHCGCDDTCSPLTLLMFTSPK
ncbi:hypothetical protein F2P81_025567 [Scophthalmus maximus]|uniref:glycerophosphocholine cholinephosphodiesterase n=1 Tax=Scophthalmus maximus TaxID=52904 RepID=A0A6A4RSI3_SCOMX|nr:hypothetical protein F2P81_025567 [Scophthalmus maximus]